MFTTGFEKTAAGFMGAMKGMMGRGGVKAVAPTVFKGNVGNKVVRDATSTAKTIAGHSNVQAARMEKGLAASKARAAAKPAGAALGGKPTPSAAAAAKPAASAAPVAAPGIGAHAEKAKNWVKANPLKSTALGAGAGYVAGKAMNNSKQQ